MVHSLRRWRYRAPCLMWRAAYASKIVRPPAAPVQFIIERADWAIRRVGESVRNELIAQQPGLMETTTHPERIAGRVAHFGSQYMWLSWGEHMSGANRYVVSYFHGKREDGPEVSAHIDKMLESVPRLSRIVASASKVEQRLISWGIPRERVVRIPIGVDTSLFSIPNSDQNRLARKKFGFDDEQLIIGSFQKDGVGWGDGMEPKLIKGPDVFLDAVTELNRHRPVAVLLTGPARGFVKKGLEDAGIPYHHTYVQDYSDLVECYHALDLYLVTSREEGGPMGLMESMASGVPVVSTDVGMAGDLIKDGITGGLVAPEDTNSIVNRSLEISVHSDQGHALRTKAKQAVAVTDWSIVARDHWTKVYQPLIEETA